MLVCSLGNPRTRLLILLVLAAAWPLAAAEPTARPRYARWDWFSPAAVSYLQEAGITHLLPETAPPAEFAAACAKAGIRILSSAAPPGVHLVREAKWPGLDPMVQTGPGGEVATTGPTGGPWIDSNGWRILYHRAVSGRPVLLCYDPPKQARLRPGSLELAVADAAVFGAQFAIQLDERMRRGLEGAQPRVLAEWKRVARQLEFADTAPFRGAPAANIAVVVEELEPVGEVLNMLSRRNLPFVAIARKEVSRAALDKFALVIAVGQAPLPVKGPVLVERKEVPNPDTLATEMRKLLADRCLYHLNNAETIISYPLWMEDGRLALHLLNYAIDPLRDVRVRPAGKFSRAQLLTPERDAPAELPLRGGELAIPEMRISAVVLLE